MLSQSTEYALRAIVYLAVTRSEPKTAEMISRAINAPISYLAKILQSLTRAHLIESQRGLHGGFTLTRRPEDISIYDVMQVVDPIVRITKCPVDIDKHTDGLCLLHATLDLAMSQVETLFRTTRISDLIADMERHRDADHCTFPKPDGED